MQISIDLKLIEQNKQKIYFKFYSGFVLLFILAGLAFVFQLY